VSSVMNLRAQVMFGNSWVTERMEVTHEGPSSMEPVDPNVLEVHSFALRGLAEYPGREISSQFCARQLSPNIQFQAYKHVTTVWSHSTA
jgi:hypothetical protein